MIWLLTHYGLKQSVVVVRARTEKRARYVAAIMMRYPEWVRVWMDPDQSDCVPMPGNGRETHFATKLYPLPLESKRRLDA